MIDTFFGRAEKSAGPLSVAHRGHREDRVPDLGDHAINLRRGVILVLRMPLEVWCDANRVVEDCWCAGNEGSRPMTEDLDVLVFGQEGASILVGVRIVDFSRGERILSVGPGSLGCHNWRVVHWRLRCHDRCCLEICSA
jgi:hypothetical protein